MQLDPREYARKKFEAVVNGTMSRDEKANALIWAAVTINAGLGAVPFGINIWTFIGVVSVLVVFLGGVYGHHLSNDGAAKIVKHIFTSVGATFFMLTMGLKFFVEVLKGVGVIGIGGPTAVGMALDAALCGAVTYALGYTSKEFFKQNKQMSPEEIKAKFKAFYAEGKSKVAGAR
jgi:uncharacterized protein (DUF697 family)